MAKALADGESVVRSFERYKAGAKDDAWLPKVGAEGMVVVTKDSRFRFRPNERVALIEANTAVFMVKADVVCAAAWRWALGRGGQRVTAGPRLGLFGRLGSFTTTAKLRETRRDPARRSLTRRQSRRIARLIERNTA